MSPDDAIQKIRELHRPIRVYDECDHKDCQAEPIELGVYMGCADSVIGWACEHCCYTGGEYPIEDCPHDSCHYEVTKENACPTNKILAEVTT